jgi:hypothetical protein
MTRSKQKIHNIIHSPLSCCRFYATLFFLLDVGIEVLLLITISDQHIVFRFNGLFAFAVVFLWRGAKVVNINERCVFGKQQSLKNNANVEQKKWKEVFRLILVRFLLSELGYVRL